MFPDDYPNKKSRAGRPKKEVDEQKIFKLAKLHCTHQEIAYTMDISVDTLVNNYSDLLERGRAVGKQSLRRAQMKAALAGNTTLMVWMGKQMLDQSDKLQTQGTSVVELKENNKKYIQDFKDLLRSVTVEKQQALPPKKKK